jgi:acetolactate synthase-1/2/3 large subunit
MPSGNRTTLNKAARRRHAVANPQLGDYDIVSYAQAFGARGYRVETLPEFAAVLKQSLSEDGPSLIDVPVDYSRNTDLAAHLHEGAFE